MYVGKEKKSTYFFSFLNSGNVFVVKSCRFFKLCGSAEIPTARFTFLAPAGTLVVGSEIKINNSNAIKFHDFLGGKSKKIFNQLTFYLEYH